MKISKLQMFTETVSALAFIHSVSRQEATIILMALRKQHSLKAINAQCATELGA